MSLISRTILWLIFSLGCFSPASALTLTAPESRVWEIFSIGYDAANTEATDLGSRVVTSTSDYDTAPIRGAITEKIPTEANRSLLGPRAEFKAAEGTGAGLNVPAGLSRNGIFGNRSGAIDWSGYPSFLPKPTGQIQLLEGDAYTAARAQANTANAALREQFDLTGMEIHEIQPVKFGGSPTDISNKIPLPTSVHRSEVTPWWNALMRNLQGGG